MVNPLLTQAYTQVLNEESRRNCHYLHPDVRDTIWGMLTRNIPTHLSPQTDRIVQNIWECYLENEFPNR